MRTGFLIFLLVLAVLPLSAGAEPPPPAPPPGIGFAGKRPPAESDKPHWGDGKTGRGPQPIKEPAKGPAYNATHIAYASVIMLAMLALTIWLIRRHRRQ